MDTDIDLPEIELLSYEVPSYSKKKVKAAGECLVKGEVDSTTLKVLNNWRSSHALPLHVISEALNISALSIDDDALLAKRLKRSPSIINKLKIQKTMSLARMQDIGGCRVIVDSVDSVYETNSKFQSRMEHLDHQLVKVNDYIKQPKQSGYRGIHLIYNFNGDGISDAHNGMKVEAQIRTLSQHYWATAVETMGAYLKQSLKSSQGDESFLEYFSRLGDLFAFYDNQPRYNEDESPWMLATTLMSESQILKIHEKLIAYSEATQLIESQLSDKYAEYFLVVTDVKAEKVRVSPIAKDELKRANEHYTKLEQRFRNDPCKDIALVSAKTLHELRDTYPNYFSDTKNFMEHYYKVVQHAIRECDAPENIFDYGNLDSMSRVMISRYVHIIKHRTKRSLVRRRQQNRGMSRKQRALSRAYRKTTNPEVRKKLAKEKEVLMSMTNRLYKKTAEIVSFYETTILNYKF